jgi:hypothetical protein
MIRTDAQFAHINQNASAALAATHPQGKPEEVRVHDFLIKKLGRAVPYGIYDLAANTGWISVGMDHDTTAFAVQTIRRWWHEIGRSRYPDAERLLITADGGGSNGSRLQLWKRELQCLANQLGIASLTNFGSQELAALGSMSLVSARGTENA